MDLLGTTFAFSDLCRRTKTKYLSLLEVEAEINRLAGVISARKDDLPSYGRSRDMGYPHIEVDTYGYHYVVVERGQELDRRTTNDFQELLYLVFDSVTSSMGSKFELSNRIQEKDSRRMAFAKKIELLQSLKLEWADREKKRQEEILERYPFDDFAGLRASYFRELRSQGLRESEISKLAYEKYPENQV